MRNITIIESYPEIDYTLVKRTFTINRYSAHEFIACYGFDYDTDTWCQGHYFNDLISAVKYIENKLNVSRETF